MDHCAARSTAGPWVNIKMSSYQYRKSHCRDKTVVRSSYLHNGISYTGKMSSLYWIRSLIRRWQYENVLVRLTVDINTVLYFVSFDINILLCYVSTYFFKQLIKFESHGCLFATQTAVLVSKVVIYLVWSSFLWKLEFIILFDNHTSFIAPILFPSLKLYPGVGIGD